MKKILLRIVLIAVGIVVAGVLAIAFLLWQMTKPTVAYGAEAEGKIKADYLAISVPHGSEAFYWFECGIDRTDYRSFYVPKETVRDWLVRIVRSRYPQAELVAGSKSQCNWINEGPNPRPWRWKEYYWNIASLSNALMYEQRHEFFCGDLNTGRIYISTWGE